MSRWVSFVVIAFALVSAACSDGSLGQSPAAPSATGGIAADGSMDANTEEVGNDGLAWEGAARGRAQQVEGLIEALPPVVPAGTLIVRGKTITTDGNTVIVQDDVPKTFADLAVGMLVHVKGTPSGSALLATRIMIQNVTGRPVNLHGIVQGLTGTASAFEFTVGGRSVHGDAATQFQNSSFASLANGSRVQVKGQQQNGFVYATRIQVKKSKP